MGAWPGLSHGVVQVGLDPVVIAAQRRCVVSAALSRRGGLTGYVVPVGHAVVDVALPADPGGVWERVGGRGQVDALAKPTWVFVGVAADPVVEVGDRLQGDLCMAQEAGEVPVQTGTAAVRSVERRVGKEGVSTCRMRWAP